MPINAIKAIKYTYKPINLIATANCIPTPHRPSNVVYEKCIIGSLVSRTYGIKRLRARCSAGPRGPGGGVGVGGRGLGGAATRSRAPSAAAALRRGGQPAANT